MLNSEKHLRSITITIEGTTKVLRSKLKGNNLLWQGVNSNLLETEIYQLWYKIREGDDHTLKRQQATETVFETSFGCGTAFRVSGTKIPEYTHMHTHRVEEGGRKGEGKMSSVEVRKWDYPEQLESKQHSKRSLLLLLLVLVFPCLILIFFCRYEAVSISKNNDDDNAVNGECITEKPVIIQVKRVWFQVNHEADMNLYWFGDCIDRNSDGWATLEKYYGIEICFGWNTRRSF